MVSQTTHFIAKDCGNEGGEKGLREKENARGRKAGQTGKGRERQKNRVAEEGRKQNTRTLCRH